MIRARTAAAAGVRCSARLCENPVFGACELCKLLILLNRTFEKSTFHTVWRWVTLFSSLLPESRSRPSAPHDHTATTPTASSACPAHTGKAPLGSITDEHS